MNDSNEMTVEWQHRVDEDSRQVFDALLALITEAVSKTGDDQ